MAFALLMALPVLRRKIKNKMPLIAHKGPQLPQQSNCTLYSALSPSAPKSIIDFLF